MSRSEALRGFGSNALPFSTADLMSSIKTFLVGTEPGKLGPT